MSFQSMAGKHLEFVAASLMLLPPLKVLSMSTKDTRNKLDLERNAGPECATSSHEPWKAILPIFVVHANAG